MTEEGRKQDQDKSQKVVEEVNPPTCWSASIVDSFTICQGNQSVKFTYKKCLKGPDM